jgi:hypothetical protein
MGVSNYKELLKHLGHKIVCVSYGPCAFGTEEPVNVAIECKTCSEVLLDYDREE